MGTFGDNLKAIRTANKISQTKLAELLDTTQQRLSEWERGKVEPTLNNILKIIAALNTTFEELTEGIPE